MTVTKILVPAPVRARVEALIAEKQKVKAIKYLRANSHYATLDQREAYAARAPTAARIGLADAKMAVEKLQGLNWPNIVLVGSCDIRSVRLDTPKGILEVDLEGLQLHGLMQLTDATMGLETCRAVISLVDTLQAWRRDQGHMPPPCDEDDT